MRIRVLKPGLQTTVQAGPRRGQRHLGVPASGAADPLSLALANRLVGNALLAPALETTLTGVSLRFESRAFVAVTGAKADVWLDGERVRRHRTLAIAAGGEPVCVAGSSGGSVQAPVFVRNLTGQTSWFASPVVVDLDGNGSNELVAAYYDIHVFSSDGTLLHRAEDGKFVHNPPRANAPLDDHLTPAR